jgi:tripartite-type tricarboxylate transporter receptor subunit TctC
MKLPRRKFLHLAAGAVALPAMSRIARAQAYPSRPVTLVVPTAAGGSPDVVARMLLSRLSELLGQQIIIENVGGAAGMNGVSRVAKAAPDGYQLVLGTLSTIAITQTLLKNPPYNASTDLTPVILVADIPLMLITRKDLPASNLQEFITYVKSNSAKMQYGSVGVGSINHLACAMLNASFGSNVVHVPYRGGGQGIQDLISGRIDFQCPLTPVAIPQIESNQVKAIAMLTRNRSPIFPNLATAHEQGVADFEAVTWLALFLPKGTPEPIVQRLQAATNAAMNTPVVKGRLKDIGVDLVADERRSSDYLRRFVVSETEKWAKMINLTGIKPE